MVLRVEGGVAYSQTFDVENRRSSVLFHVPNKGGIPRQVGGAGKRRGRGQDGARREQRRRTVCPG